MIKCVDVVALLVVLDFDPLSESHVPLYLYCRL